MSQYFRAGKPAIYTSRVHFQNHLRERKVGSRVSVVANENAHTWSFHSTDGGSVDSLFDFNPEIVNTFDTNGSSQPIRLRIDTEFTTDSLHGTEQLWILNHNFEGADATFKVFYDDSSSFASATTPTYNKKVNCGDASATTCDPTYNGWSMVELVQSTDNRYVYIEIHPTSSTFAIDIRIGSILLTKRTQFPQAPDVNMKIDKEIKNTITEALSGKRYSTMTDYQYNFWGDYPAWDMTTTDTGKLPSRVGRHIFDYSFSMMRDTDVWNQSEYAGYKYDVNDSGALLEEQFFDRAFQSHYPMILQLDGDTYTSAGDGHTYLSPYMESKNYYLVRLMDYKTTQIAPNLWNVQCRFEEEL